MIRAELRKVSLKYQTAYTAYMNSVHDMVVASHEGQWPSRDVLEEEERAMKTLNLTRRSLLDALCSHTTRERKHVG